MITSNQIRPKKWISWILGSGMVRTFGRREGGEYFPAEYWQQDSSYRSEKTLSELLLGFCRIGALRSVKFEIGYKGSGNLYVFAHC